MGAGDRHGARAAALAALVDQVDAQTRQRPHAPGTHPEFDRLVRTIWRLRQSDGCPWDKVQTHDSITKNMVEEAYEAVEVTCVKISDTKNPRGLCRSQHLPRLRQRALEALEELVHHVGRHPVADCRVGAPAVAAGLYEADHGEPRLLARGRRAVVVHLVLEGREEGLCHRVVVAAAGAAAREPHVVFPGPRRQQPRGVLAAAVAVEDGPSAT